MPADRRPNTRVLIIGGAILAAIVVVIIIVIATGGDDDEEAAPSTSELVIQSPATVTGITGVTGADSDEAVRGSSAATSTPGAVGATTYPLLRTVESTGTLDCNNLGSWQPFVEIQITFRVGQPAANETCGDDVLDLPPGFCTTACAEVPGTWHVVEDPGVSPQALMLIVAPTDETTNTGQLLCVRDFVPQLKKILPLATPIAEACQSTTSNSVEIPYVPPATSDIPYVPPPASVDIPPATG